MGTFPAIDTFKIPVVWGMNLQAGNGIHDSFNLSREAVNYGEVTDCRSAHSGRIMVTLSWHWNIDRFSQLYLPANQAVGFLTMAVYLVYMYIFVWIFGIKRDCQYALTFRVCVVLESTWPKSMEQNMFSLFTLSDVCFRFQVKLLITFSSPSRLCVNSTENNCLE